MLSLLEFIGRGSLVLLRLICFYTVAMFYDIFFTLGKQRGLFKVTAGGTDMNV